MGGVAGGRYKAIQRGGKWVVRAPDGRVVKDCGPGDAAKKEADTEADRLNEKLRAVDGK